MEEKEVNFISFLNKIERDYPVSQWRMNNVDVWPLLRIQLGFNIKVNETPISNNVIIEDNSIGKLPLLTDILNKEEDVDVFVLFDSLSRIKLGDIWYHRLSGPFNEEVRKMGLNVVNLEFSHHNIERFPVFDESYSITNQLRYMDEYNCLNPQYKLEKYNKVKKEFFLEFGENLKFPTIYSINKLTFNIQKLSYIFEVLFLKKKTKVVFVVNYYQYISHAIILAARRIGIPSVDIQHGNQLNLFYHKWLNVPKEGYNILPDYFWCWEKKNTFAINEWADDTIIHKAINGGNPWIELWQNNNHPFVKEHEKLMTKFIDENKVNILITLQPLYGLIDWKKNIPDWVIKAIDKSPDNWKWYIRYHPQMLGKYLNEKKECEEVLSVFIDNGKVETEQSTELPLMALLRAMTVHITAFSTCVIEAKYLQVPSITLHPHAEEYFDNEYTTGWANKATDTEDLLEKIRTFVINKKAFKLPILVSDSIGLSKGISIILKREKNYLESNINQSIIQSEVYFADKRYNEIVDEYEKNPLRKINFIVGRAYEKINEEKKAFNLYQQYLKSLQRNLNKGIKDNIDIRELILIKKFYQQQFKNEEIENLNTFIYHLISQLEYVKSQFFQMLFRNRDYSEIKLWGDKIIHNIDVKFFLGRALLELGERKKGIELLNDYLFLRNSSENNPITSITLEKNYQVSAHLYLGEAYISQQKYHEARDQFNQCNILWNGYHKKATEYLRLYKNW
ncbi:tetratricopeptide repeat protein [Niallia circulans]|uniref:tetratricopeptide repeat protein n=1 Tax=Niallia circulans TaxID=1397 RepID=UPI0035241CB6